MTFTGYMALVAACALLIAAYAIYRWGKAEAAERRRKALLSRKAKDQPRVQGRFAK